MRPKKAKSQESEKQEICQFYNRGYCKHKEDCTKKNILTKSVMIQNAMKKAVKRDTQTPADLATVVLSTN